MGHCVILIVENATHHECQHVCGNNVPYSGSKCGNVIVDFSEIGESYEFTLVSIKYSLFRLAYDVHTHFAYTNLNES